MQCTDLERSSEKVQQKLSTVARLIVTTAVSMVKVHESSWYMKENMNLLLNLHTVARYSVI